MNLEYVLEEKELTIVDSYKITNISEMESILFDIKFSKNTNSKIFNRSANSLIKEWLVSNFICRKNVTFKVKQSLKKKLICYLIGNIFLIIEYIKEFNSANTNSWYF